MSATDHWFRFNIGDYLADTLHFSTLQHGIYIKLLLHAYKHGGMIPEDERELAQIAGTTALIWRANNGPCVGCFLRVSGGYQHKRVVEELERAKVISSMGKHAAAHRWSKGNGDADRNADRYANQELEPESEGSVASRPPRAQARATDRRQNAFMELGQALARQQRKGSHGH